MAPSASSVASDGRKPSLDDGPVNSAKLLISEKLRQAETNFVGPLRAIFKDAFKNYPTATSYFMIFCGLSLLPIMCFVGFTIFTASALLAIGLVFVLTWGGVMIGSALFALLLSLAFLAFATFWIVIALFSTIFVLRLIYNVQKVFMHQVGDSQLFQDMSQHLHEKGLKRKQREREANAEQANITLVSGVATP